MGKALVRFLMRANTALLISSCVCVCVFWGIGLGCSCFDGGTDQGVESWDLCYVGHVIHFLLADVANSLCTATVLSAYIMYVGGGGPET